MPFIAPIVAAIAASPILSFIVKLGISFAIGKIQQKRMESKMRKQQEAAKAQATAVMINSSSNSDPVSIIYGRTRVGGIRTVVESTGEETPRTDGTQFLNMTLAMSEGRVADIKKLYFDDTVVWDVDSGGTIDGAGLLANYITDTDYAPALNASGTSFHYYDGSDNQAADADLVTEIPGWTTNHRLRGLAYMAIKLKANADVYKGGLPLITAEIQGKFIQDINSVTAGDTTRTLINSGQDADPVDVLYDYLINPRYGKGLDHTSPDASDPDAGYQAGLHIDIASFQTAKSDINGFFKINGAVNTAELIYNNVGELLESMNGMLVFQNGKYRLKIKQQNEPSVMNIGYDEIIGAVALQLPGKQNKYNRMKADFRSKEAGVDYNDDIVVVDNPTYLTEDNDQTLEARMRLDYVDDQTLVTALTTFAMDESRYNAIVSFETAHNTLKVECGDIITLTLPDFGWETGKLFRVAEMSISAEDTISFTAQEYESSIQLI